MSVRARRDGDLASSPNEHSSCILPHYHTRKCTCPPHTHGHMQGARLTRLMQPRLALALEEDEPRHCRSLRRRCRATDARRRRRTVRERAAPLLEAQRDALRHKHAGGSRRRSPARRFERGRNADSCSPAHAHSRAVTLALHARGSGRPHLQLRAQRVVQRLIRRAVAHLYTRTRVLAHPACTRQPTA